MAASIEATNILPLKFFHLNFSDLSRFALQIKSIQKKILRFNSYKTTVVSPINPLNVGVFLLLQEVFFFVYFYFLMKWDGGRGRLEKKVTGN